MSTNFLIDPTTGKIYSYLVNLTGGGGSNFTVTGGTAIYVQSNVVDTATQYTINNLQTFTCAENMTVTQSGDNFYFTATGFEGTVLTGAGGIRVDILDGNVYEVNNTQQYTGQGSVTATQNANEFIFNINTTALSLTCFDGTMVVAKLGDTGTTEFQVSNNVNLLPAPGSQVTVTQDGATWILAHEEYANISITNGQQIDLVQTGNIVELSSTLTLTSSNDAKLTITQNGSVNILTVTDQVLTVTGGNQPIIVHETTIGSNTLASVYMAGITGNGTNTNVEYIPGESGFPGQYQIYVYPVVSGSGCNVVVTNNEYEVTRPLYVPAGNLTFTQDGTTARIGQKNLTTYFLGNRELQVTDFPSVNGVNAGCFGNPNNGVINTDNFNMSISNLSYSAGLAFQQISDYIADTFNVDTNVYLLVIQHESDFASYSISGLANYGLPDASLEIAGLTRVGGVYNILANPGDICSISLVPAPIE